MSASSACEIEITLGVGRRSPRGRRLRIPAGELARAIAEHQPAREAWWSVHTWEGDHRGKERWQEAAGVCIDIDHEQGGVHCAPDPDTRLAMEEATLGMPGSLFHHTPRGARVIFAFAAPCRDQSLYLRACEGAMRLTERAIAQVPGYRIDVKATTDLARLMWAPSTVVDGQAREARVVDLRQPTYTPEELAAHAEPEPVKQRPAAQMESPLAAAMERWVRDHPQDWGTHRPCPACDGKDSFSAIPGSHRWVCHHTSHQAPGRPSTDGTCHTGDALDLEAWRTGLSVVEILRRDGYLPMPPVRPLPQAAQQEPPGASVHDIQGPREITRSFASLCAILRHDRRIVEEELAWNEMLSSATIGGDAITDVTISQLRERIELHIQDSKGNGLKFSAADIEAAIDLVAQEQKYNPVAEYLQGLSWDGTQRLNYAVEDILGAERSVLNQALFRRWAISAVARALQPGCKVDTVLILQGPQGARKSTFFREMAGTAWFADSPVDIQSKDAMMLLRRVWILEWAELESMQRARDSAAVKAFISSPEDVFRMPYGRKIITAPRHSIIVGTTNEDGFLTDSTGARRYWIIPIAAEIHIQALRDQRDQLWAEAVHLYRQGEQWWLTTDEEALLLEVHERHRRVDAWEDRVLDWVEKQAGPRTSGDILEGALDKPPGQWNPADARRIASIMRGAGYTQFIRRGTRYWTKGSLGEASL